MPKTCHRNVLQIRSNFGHVFFGSIVKPCQKFIFVRNSYIYFQRPSRTRALENVTLGCELGKMDAGVVLVMQNGKFWWVMLELFFPKRVFLRAAAPRPRPVPEILTCCPVGRPGGSALGVFADGFLLMSADQCRSQEQCFFHASPL